MSCIAKKTSIVAATSELERLFSPLIYREYVSWKHYEQFTWVLMDHLADIAEGTKPGFRRENQGAQTTMYYFVCFFCLLFFFLVPLVTYMKSMTFSGQFLLRC